MWFSINDIECVQQQLVEVFHADPEHPRLDLSNQVPPVGLAIIRLEIRIEDVQTALVYAGKGQVMAAAGERAGLSAGVSSLYCACLWLQKYWFTEQVQNVYPFFPRAYAVMPPRLSSGTRLAICQAARRSHPKPCAPRYRLRPRALSSAQAWASRSAWAVSASQKGRFRALGVIFETPASRPFRRDAVPPPRRAAAWPSPSGILPWPARRAQSRAPAGRRAAAPRRSPRQADARRA